ncbi:hypothetical protein Hanom_Chr17g01533721 [Helianthus anomalus]
MNTRFVRSFMFVNVSLCFFIYICFFCSFMSVYLNLFIFVHLCLFHFKYISSYIYRYET